MHHRIMTPRTPQFNTQHHHTQHHNTTHAHTIQQVRSHCTTVSYHTIITITCASLQYNTLHNYTTHTIQYNTTYYHATPYKLLHPNTIIYIEHTHIAIIHSQTTPQFNSDHYRPHHTTPYNIIHDYDIQYNTCLCLIMQQHTILKKSTHGTGQPYTTPQHIDIQHHRVT